MIQNMYAKIIEGNVDIFLFPAIHVSTITVISLKELSDLSISELYEKGWVLVEILPMPKDGYRYINSVPTQDADGVWKASWTQQETPERANVLLELSRIHRKGRDILIKENSWRYERYARNQRLGLEQQDNIDVLDAYVKALTDVPEQTGFPWDIQWPVPPGIKVT